MFCLNCGDALVPNARFCGKCGKPTEEPASADPIGLPQSPLLKWLIASLAAVIVLAGAFLWMWQSDFSFLPAGPQVSSAAESKSDPDPAPAPLPSASPSTDSDQREPEQTAAVETSAAPAYIRINQVDSGDYANGKVDVYFSLFSDENFENELRDDRLSAKMFKIDDRPVSDFAFVRPSDNVSVNLVLDKSGSMAKQASAYDSATKIERVRSAAINFIQSVPQEFNGQFEILSFSNYAPSEPDLPFTSDLAKVENQLAYYESDNGETALYDSLTEALYSTNEVSGPKYIIAFTDGYDSGYGASAYSVIELSKQLGIPIYTIGFGDAETDLSDIALQTGGQSFSISEEDDLQQELQHIYSDVFERYTRQYKITYTPSRQVVDGQEFSFVLDMKSHDYTARTDEQIFTRKLDQTFIAVQSALSDYQTNYTRAVNEPDFGMVSDNVKFDSAFYRDLKDRIENDYTKNPKKVDPIQNARIESVHQRPDGSYEIEYFKFFSFREKERSKYEADRNTYVMTQDPSSSQWQVSEFTRGECSIYENANDPGKACGKGEQSKYSGNPWTLN
ncbi:VWA domain-containing protein [Saccharibacillus deserti]|uniref:VWA domain-containing protein n=1 Tax=Saccharibacillus deserti TaxID=1634444 RepID=UPI001FE3E69F|nr:VWA domain-containing protein [Saccharibacillus deserti]